MVKRSTRVTPEEERRAYEVLARRFGFPAAYIQAFLEDHFSRLPRVQQVRVQAEISADWTLDELRGFLASLDALRAEGLLPPRVQCVEMNRIKKDTRGKSYVASDEQLQQELELQRRLSIDPDGNLVMKDGTLIKAHWLQSFATWE
jgi:hypothetical protein